MGEVAGLGGLGLGLFFLIVRLVLQTVPLPKNIPAAPYLKLVNRIIVFAFILALVGLGIYGTLQVTRRP